MTEIRTNWGRRRSYADPPQARLRLWPRAVEQAAEPTEGGEDDERTRVVPPPTADAGEGRDAALSRAP